MNRPDGQILVPWTELFPGKWNEHKNAIITKALPFLLQVMLDSNTAQRPLARLVSPRQKVDYALTLVEEANQSFWGRWDVFSRRRSVIDSILAGYYDTLWSYVASRGPV